MIVVRTCFIIAMLFLFLPYGVGCLLTSCRSNLFSWITGLATLFTLFELFGLTFHAILGSLTLMTFLWCGVCFAMAIAGLCKKNKRQKRKIEKKKTPHRWTGGEAVLFFAAVCFFLLQTFNTVFRIYYGNWDDHIYCAIATSSWYTDTVNRYSPVSGILKSAFYDRQYTIPNWPVFSAVLSVLTGLHPATVFRTLLPLVEVPASYGIAYLILKIFFRKDEDRRYALLALLYIEIFTVITAERAGDSSGEFWAVVNCWSGKALSASIALPIVLLFLFRIENVSNKLDRRDAWIGLCMSSWGSCLFSASLFFLIPVEIAVWGGCYLLRTKRWRDFWKLSIAGSVPIVFAAFTYVF